MRIQITLVNVLTLILILSVSLSAQDTSITDSNGRPIPKALLNRISIDLKEVPFPDALSEIANKGKFYLNYHESYIPTHKKVSINLKNVPAIEALKKVLEQSDINIIVTKAGQVVLVESKLTKTRQEYTISGYVKDATTGEMLIGTNIYIEKLQRGCSTNAYGFYSLTIPPGHYKIRYRYIGYEAEEIAVNLSQKLKQNVELRETVISGETVTVTAEIQDENIKTTEMGTIRLAPKKYSYIPALFGEQDILKTIHFLPGVTQSREGDSGFYVRGGNSAQNLVLLDEAPVYNAFHLSGFLSVFNSDAIKDVKLMKGLAPPKYGGRISSVLDIQMNEGNLKKFHGSAGIGLLFSRFTFQGPIVKR